MTFEDFKEDTIALLNSRVAFEDDVLDALMYNIVKVRERQHRDDADLLNDIGNAGLTD